jgi:O-acetyl-ADP-ribose deacetylase (regulator of RNase III)
MPKLIQVLNFTFLFLFSSFSFAGASFFEFEKSKAKFIISAEGTQTDKELKVHQMVPRGSAVMTPSGALERTGIKNIIHVAPGSMTKSGTKFSPSLEGLRLSLKNVLIIAEKQKLPCVAIPFIGGGIFLNSLNKTKLEVAKELIASVSQSTSIPAVTFVTWGNEDTLIFKEALKTNTHKNIRLASGSITDFKTHQCPTIVNAANMEVQFGGGLSGVIGKATGDPEIIDGAVKEAIKEYYK